jgi:hypothetical protein
MPYSPPNAVQLQVTLPDIQPPVWRQIVVPIDWHLGQLHLAIQAAFNWWNCHLHEFTIGGLRFGAPEQQDDIDPTDTPRTFNEQTVRLRDFATATDAPFRYLYDFGDGWNHVLQVEDCLTLDPAPKIATCTAGARARPPEDVGGPYGYERFLAIITDPTDDEYKTMKQWAGGHFDPDWFDLAITNKDLQNALKPTIRRRLYQPRPRKPKPMSQPQSQPISLRAILR